MKETIFEQVATAASVLKLDLSAEEFALFAEDQEFSETGLEAHYPDFVETEPPSYKGA